jgi:hypothetical protein
VFEQEGARMKRFVNLDLQNSQSSKFPAFGDLINVAAEFSHVLEDWPTPIILVP